jgi:biotin carboxyl carrier protein
MEIIQIKTPPTMLGEESCKIKRIFKNNLELVGKGDLILVLESSNALLEITAEVAGKIIISRDEGDFVKVGEILFNIEKE